MTNKKIISIFLTFSLLLGITNLLLKSDNQPAISDDALTIVYTAKQLDAALAKKNIDSKKIETYDIRILIELQDFSKKNDWAFETPKGSSADNIDLQLEKYRNTVKESRVFGQFRNRLSHHKKLVELNFVTQIHVVYNYGMPSRYYS